MHIREEDKNPDLYTETYYKWEEWMVGEIVCFHGQNGTDWGLVTKKDGELRLWAVWEKEDWDEFYVGISSVKFKKRHTNKDSKVKVLAVKTVAIPTEIEFEGRVYILKEDV